ncbi:MAG: ribbon-helix-helix protein, CopG family [Pyrobaculum sp.]|uniref:ribbon-helix-helix protein, CopG family n=1 Tax=Pyrobaculum sp. TaxID=2004705 RepID=UPI0031783A10
MWVRHMSGRETKRKWIRYTLQISPEQYYYILKNMERLGYRTISEFIRDAIREKLERGEQR